MSPTDSTDELRKQIAAEREQLVAATSELRAEVDELKRKVPKVAAAVSPPAPWSRSSVAFCADAPSGRGPSP